jgi:hypothetical protein
VSLRARRKKRRVVIIYTQRSSKKTHHYATLIKKNASNGTFFYPFNCLITFDFSCGFPAPRILLNKKCQD